MAFPRKMHDASLYSAWAARHGNHDDQNLNAALRFQSVKKAGLSTGEPETEAAFLPGGAGAMMNGNCFRSSSSSA
uniref:Uncharacterized protein n=1 Tax=Herbaspirillum huttiense subsp. nephrolepidis TaxID=3075126 RepID=A0AAE4G5F4_9BURK